MLLLIWLVLCLAAAPLILLPYLLRQREIYKRYSGARLVACPESKKPAAVSIDAWRAASTEMDGHPDLRVSDCTRWPERVNCGQACLTQVVQAKPYTPEEVKPGKKQIYHLPVLLAAFTAWCLGIIWHSHYMFRAQWMGAVGVTREQVKQIVWWFSPHLLSIGVCLLFAYGVAWLLAVRHRKGVVQGILMSVLLCGALGAASWYGIQGLPHELLIIEAGYILVAALTVGAMVGGLYDKLVLPPH
jgi:Protein of unknown function (DUF1761)